MVDKEKEVIITQAQYIASAVKKEQYPEKKMPEFVFIGRSNVGKSSLINSLTRVKGLARVSAQPGKTQTINFYELGVKLPGEEERRACYLVDLPGYGYAKTGRERRATCCCTAFLPSLSAFVATMSTGICCSTSQWNIFTSAGMGS